MFSPNPLRSPVAALTLGACLVMPMSATAQTRFPKECALKELPIVTLIEEHGESGDVSADRLASAWAAMLDARAACAEGRVSEALAQYQGILDLGPVQRSASAAPASK